MTWQPIEDGRFPKWPQHFIAWREDAGWFACFYGAMCEFMSERELEAAREEYDIDDDTTIEQEDFWAFHEDGISRLEGDEAPTWWMVPPEPLPAPPVAEE